MSRQDAFADKLAALRKRNYLPSGRFTNDYRFFPPSRHCTYSLTFLEWLPRAISLFCRWQSIFHHHLFYEPPTGYAWPPADNSRRLPPPHHRDIFLDICWPHALSGLAGDCRAARDGSRAAYAATQCRNTAPRSHGAYRAMPRCWRVVQ